MGHSRVIRRPGPGADRLHSILTQPDGVGKTGWFESAKYEDGTPVAYVAAIQEYGDPTHNIPPRSFMRTTVAEKRTEWANLMRRGAQAIMAGGETMFSVLEKVSGKAAGDIRIKISRITEPPLKPSTIAARRSRSASGEASTKPLVDTGHMLATVSNAVEPK
jgi:hypothetical protein